MSGSCPFSTSPTRPIGIIGLSLRLAIWVYQFGRTIKAGGGDILVDLAALSPVAQAAVHTSPLAPERIHSASGKSEPTARSGRADQVQFRTIETNPAAPTTAQQTPVSRPSRSGHRPL